MQSRTLIILISFVVLQQNIAYMMSSLSIGRIHGFISRSRTAPLSFVTNRAQKRGVVFSQYALLSSVSNEGISQSSNIGDVIGSSEKSVKTWLRGRKKVSSIDEIQARIEMKALNESLSYHDNLYYNLATPEITDAVYDRLLRRASDISKLYPTLRSLVPRLENVGGDKSEGFAPYHHQVPMLSLDNVFSVDELRSFIQKIVNKVGNVDFVVEPKIDGLSLSIKYENGNLVSAGSRGDGKIGEDVTENVRMIENIPLQLNSNVSIDVRGEVYMPRSTLTELNQFRKDANQSLFSNSRNAAAGSLRQQDKGKSRSRNLKFFAYQIVLNENSSDPALAKLNSQVNTLEFLRSQNFSVAEPTSYCSNADEVINSVLSVESNRKNIDFDIDGVVVKIDNFEKQKLLGMTSKFPRWATAFKYAAQEGTTRLKEIIVQVGRTGVLTPVAILEPIQIGGVTIERATLHNQEEVNRLGVHPGVEVRVARAGDVVPKILHVVSGSSSNSSIFKLPETCPVCGSKTEGNLTAVRCTGGMKCSAQVTERISHFCSRDAMNIQGLGGARAEFLHQHGFVSNLSDLMSLRAKALPNSTNNSSDTNSTPKCLGSMVGWGDKSVAKLLDMIDKQRKVDMYRFLYALGINGIGLENAKEFSKFFESVESFVDCIDKQPNKLLEMKGIGTKTIDNLKSFFSDSHLREDFDKLIVGLQISNSNFQSSIDDFQKQIKAANNTDEISKTKDDNNSSQFSGKTFVFTGTLKGITRAAATKMLIEKGASVSSRVTKAVDYLIASDDSSSTNSKLAEAKQKNIPILTESEWKNRMGLSDCE